MSALWWVRHGPTGARGMIGWSDLPADLSDAAALARLRDHLPRPAALISSDLSRSVATADALQEGRDRLPHDSGLREIHFGAWETRLHDDIAATDPALSRAFWEEPGDTRPPGGESWNELRARVDASADRLAALGGDVVVVAHFGAILTQIQRALGLEGAEAFAHRIDTLSVTRIAWQGDPPSWRADPINLRP